MVVFLVMKSTGSYEDYYKRVDKVFASREEADAYIADRVMYWSAMETRLKMCRRCPFCWAIEDAQNQEMFEQKALNHCPDAEFDWERKRMLCELDLWDDQIPTYSVDEREVEMTHTCE